MRSDVRKRLPITSVAKCPLSVNSNSNSKEFNRHDFEKLFINIFPEIRQ